ncbi:MAG TPA: zinc ribbon domain-containing protein [Phycisphaerae bacterium]|nr:hypothetical protein [Phycisphaerales bacterium]HNO78193.1 zinc ribbon domain-containing protein [Phycisphaerae bacterium]
MFGGALTGGIGVGILFVVLFGVLVALFSVAALIFAIVRVVLLAPLKLLGLVAGTPRPYVEKRPRVHSKRLTSAHLQSPQVHGGRKECTNPRCGYANRSNAVYCAQCGQQLRNRMGAIVA